MFIAGTVVALIMVWFNNSVLPETNHRLKALTTDIRRKKPTIALVNGVFSQDLPGYSMLVRKTSEKSNDLEGVTLYDYTNPTKNIVITAERGAISFSPDFRKIIMLLYRGEIHELDMQERCRLPEGAVREAPHRHGCRRVRLRTIGGLCVHARATAN